MARGLQVRARRITLFKLPPLKRYLPVVLFAAIFGSVGTYLLINSHAATVDSTTANIFSLAPASANLKQGDIINIAVNLDTAETASSIKAVVTYPAASLQLQAVRDICPSPNFTNSIQDTTVAGTVSIGCSSTSAGVTGKKTIAILVFKALTSNGDTPLTVGNGSISRKADGASVDSRPAFATMKLATNKPDSVKKPRIVPNYQIVDTCPPAGPGKATCLGQTVVSADGSPINQTDATVKGYGPVEFHTAYQLPCTPGGPVQSICATPSTYGPETVAITVLSGYATGTSGLESDLQTYNQQFGLPPCTLANGCLNVVNQRGAITPLPNAIAGWADEIAMDVSAVHTICQTCKIVLIETDSNNIADSSAAVDYAASLKPMATSHSWAFPDSAGDYVAYDSKYVHPGVPQLFASGDHGEPPAGKSGYPAPLPSVIAVSGTTLQLNTDGTIASETLWTYNPTSTWGTGGGCSVTYAAPTWQTSIPTWGQVGCGTKRSFGDIAIDANPNTGIALYAQGSWKLYGGTSLAAPLIAGMYGVAGAGATPASAEPGQLLYQRYASNAANFRDITSGNNCLSAATAQCTASPGFDVPSGLGVPKGVVALGGTTPPATPPPPPTPPPTIPPPPPPPPTTKVGDINKDGKVNITDLSILLTNWNKTTSTGDLNGDGKVNVTDMSILLSHWNT